MQSDAAPTVFTGTLQLNGNAQFDYGAGGTITTITTIATGATLNINSAAAKLSSAGDGTTNGALAGLLENDGSLQLSGAVLTPPPPPPSSMPEASR